MKQNGKKQTGFSRSYLREFLITAAMVLVILFAAVTWNLWQEKKLAVQENQAWNSQAKEPFPSEESF